MNSKIATLEMAHDNRVVVVVLDMDILIAR